MFTQQIFQDKHPIQVLQLLKNKEISILWHRRLGHASMHTISKLISKRPKLAKDQKQISLPIEWKYVGSHSKELILRDSSQGIRTRSKREEINHITFVSQVEPHNLEEAEEDPNWMMAMHEELNEFKRNDVWTLVNRSSNHPIIGTKMGLQEQAE